MEQVVNWTDLKGLKIQKVVLFQYIEKPSEYEIWIQDGIQIYNTKLFKDTTNIEGLDVTQNNLDLTDWETNFKANARGRDSFNVNILGGTVEHRNGTANIAVSTVTFSGITKHVQIENMNSVNNILISFDGGINFRILQPGTALDIDGAMTDLKIKASADGTLYEILAIV